MRSDLRDLIAAIYRNDVDALRVALATVRSVNQTNDADLSPLICAIRDGRPEIVQLLIEHGADPRQRDRITPWTPFMLASIQIHLPASRQRPARIARASVEIVRILEKFDARDAEAEGIYGRIEQESVVLRSVKRRGACAATRMFDAEGVVIEYPDRLAEHPHGRLLPSISLFEMARIYRWEKVAALIAV